MNYATIRLEDFAATSPAEWAWIEANYKTFDFASAMRERIVSHGFLTPNMLAAIHRCMSRVKPNVEDAPTVDTTKIEAVFARINPTLKKPALNVGDYRFSPAPATGKNPGATYVKQDGVYLGKMLGGRFLASATQEAIARLTPDTLSQVLGIASDPLGKAIEHGRITGRCAICNRNLKDEDSTDRGIGPVCYKKVFSFVYGE